MKQFEADTTAKPVSRKSMADDWIVQIILTVFVIYLFVFMEWLFFVTKTSFMSALSFFHRMQVLWVTPIPIVAAGIIVLILCWFPTR